MAVPPGISSPANPSCQSPARPGTKQCLLGWQHPPRSLCPLHGVSSLQFPRLITKLVKIAHSRWLSTAYRCHEACNTETIYSYKLL